MDNALRQLITISNTVGKDSRLVQGVGGNTSVKTNDDKYMYIKASGTALKDMNNRRGWRRLRTQVVRDIFKDKSLSGLAVDKREREMVNRLLSACDDEQGRGVRPSVESTLHVVLGKCVIHLHALAALAYGCAKNGKEQIDEIFSDQKYPPLWVRYTDPGFSLGRKVCRLVRGYEKEFGAKPSIMFLQNHGLIISTDEPDEALKLLKKVISRCNAHLKPLAKTVVKKASPIEVKNVKLNIKKALLEISGRQVTVRHFAEPVVLGFSERKDAEQLLKAPALTPDEMGFVKSPAIWLDKYDYKTISVKVAFALRKTQNSPVAFLAEGLGLFIAAEPKLTNIIKNLVAGSLFIRANAKELGGITALDRRQRQFIKNWESETFRINKAQNE